MLIEVNTFLTSKAKTRFTARPLVTFVRGLLLSGPLGFTCWISFALVFSLGTADSLSLLYLLFIS